LHVSSACTALFVSAQDSADSVETAVLLLEAAADVPLEVTRSPLTDLVSVVTTTRGHPIALDVPASAVTVVTRRRPAGGKLPGVLSKL